MQGKNDKHFPTDIANPPIPTLAFARALNTAGKAPHYWRASEERETLSGVYKFELVRHMYKIDYSLEWFMRPYNS